MGIYVTDFVKNFTLFICSTGILDYTGVGKLIERYGTKGKPGRFGGLKLRGCV